MIKSQMEQQLRVLKELDDLIARSDAEGKTGTASAEDVDHLRAYASDMRRACSTAIALETALTPPKEEKKAEEKKPAKRKPRAKKAEPVVETPPADAPAPETAEAEDDDLSFLD
ncbi:hypothetical protein [Selenomonas noxia]|uniref:hypothetical protein n=1 Tax=Selenomonas noxia TaxID=135083 RepID=UPI0028D40B55|nr:hypothetical protein [Selenomonas noxia]